MTPDPARNRFFAIQALRLGGVALVIVALLALKGVVPLPQIAAWPILVVGLADILVVPALLARRWRTPPQNEDRP